MITGRLDNLIKKGRLEQKSVPAYLSSLYIGCNQMTMLWQAYDIGIARVVEARYLRLTVGDKEEANYLLSSPSEMDALMSLAERPYSAEEKCRIAIVLGNLTIGKRDVYN